MGKLQAVKFRACRYLLLSEYAQYFQTRHARAMNTTLTD